MSRARLTRLFLWLSVIGWGIGLGAAIYDLLVLGTAWGADPPGSLSLLPYGARFPIDPGNFFQPLSAVMVVAVLGALISGSKTSRNYRVWLWAPVIAFAIIWVFTPTVFWPMIDRLWEISRGRSVVTKAAAIALVRRWFVFDTMRIVAIALGFLASIRAISVPYPGEVAGKGR
ncbi:MAG TPA: DUF1772 domain-containing protein [Acidisarcina sp.]